MKKIFFALLPLIFLLTLSGCDPNRPDGEEFISEMAGTVTEPSKETNVASDEDFDYTIRNGCVNIREYIGKESVVVIPETIEGLEIRKIDEHFLEDSVVEELTFPSCITVFGGLSRCESLKIIHLPASIEKMPFTLRFCENLEEIDIEEGGAYKTVDGVLYTSDMKTLVSYPCGRTNGFVVPDGVEIIGAYAFYNSKVSEIVFPESLKAIEGYAFMKAEALKEANIPSSVKTIGVYAFSESGIEKAALPEGVEEISVGAFVKTKIKELYLPDSVVKCGDVADDNVLISASYPHDGCKPLWTYENVCFRDETMLEEAFRKSKDVFKVFEENYRYGTGNNGIIAADITGDNFPEIMRIYGSDSIIIYFFSEKGGWRLLNDYSIDSGFQQGNLAFHLLYDEESDTYSYYSEVYNYWVWGTMSDSYVTCQCKISFPEDGLVYTYLFDEDIRDLSSETIIETMDVSGILNGLASEYGIDFEDSYKQFTLITGGFAEEPNGKIWEKPLTLNGKNIEAFPYFESGYPEEMKLTVCGKDMLRGEEIDGVYFKHGVLTLDNAAIDAGGEKYIIEAANMYELKIELIGENRIVSESPCSLLNTDGGVVFTGNGSLEAPKIETKSIMLEDGAALKGNNALADGRQWLNVNYLILSGDSSVEGGTAAAGSVVLNDSARLNIKSLICDTMSLGGSSSAEIINDTPGAMGLDACAVTGVNSIRIGGSARLYADNSAQNYDTLYFYGNNPWLSVSDSGRLEINGSIQGAGIEMFNADFGTVEIYDEGSIVINGSKTCIAAPRVEIAGGSVELNACAEGIALKVKDETAAVYYNGRTYYPSSGAGYYIFGTVLFESPGDWEIVKDGKIGVMYSGGRETESYRITVKQAEYYDITAEY